jgi:hypothetical protein
MLADRVICAQALNPHDGQWATIHLWPGPDERGQRLLLESDGARGRGHAELMRDTSGVHAQGVVLPGIPARVDARLEPAATLDVREMFAGKLLLLPALAKLGVGQSFEVPDAELSLGSTIDIAVKPLKVTRVADGPVSAEGGHSITVQRFEIGRGKGPPSVLSLDERGWPLRYEIDAFGSKVRFERTVEKQ